MPTDILTQTVHHNIRPQLERIHQHRRGKSVVSHHDDVLVDALGDFDDGRNVEHLHHGVDDRLSPDYLCVLFDPLLEVVELGDVSEIDFKAMSELGELFDVVKSATVGVLTHENVVAWLKSVQNSRHRSCS